MSKTIPILSLLATGAAIAADAPKWYEEMKIGPAWSNTFEHNFHGEKQVAAVKGILLDLGDEKTHALFDSETLGVTSAYEGFVNWGGTPWTGAHAKLISLQDDTPIFSTDRTTAAWADAKGSFEDTRPITGYGNFAHARFQGYFRSGSIIVLDYTVLGTRVLETSSAANGTVTRSFEVAARKSDLATVLADAAKPFTVAADGLSAKSEDGLSVVVKGGGKLVVDSKTPTRLVLQLPKGDKLNVQVGYTRGAEPKLAAVPDFATLIKGGAPLWKEKIVTEGKVGATTDEPYVTDVATLPVDNPWKANLRFGGFDFIDADSAALSTWNGDVWVVKGLKGDWKELEWQRIASGLFEPLGLKVVNGVIHVNGRDQITQLIDLNGDGETDQFKTFNRDVYVTENFHEFAFDLQTDKQGNFYFSKAGPVRSGGRGFDRILPHNGTVVKVSADGSKLEVVATGLRAPGGVGVGPNGEITTGENEGTWEPACKINFVRASDTPAFFGCEPTRQEIGEDLPYTEPLCFLPMDMDNSGASQVWVPENAKFGLNPGEMLHLSYGQSSIFRVLPQRVDGKLQGAVSKLPIDLQSSAMRARFAEDGSMYVVGFRGWQTNAATESAFQRIRYTGAVLPAPEKFEAIKTGVRLEFAQPLDEELAADPTSFTVERWNYVRSSQYGSGEFSVDNPDPEAEKAAIDNESHNVKKRDSVKVTAAKLLPDGKTVELTLESMKPSMQLSVNYDLEDKKGDIIKGNVTGTVYNLQ